MFSSRVPEQNEAPPAARVPLKEIRLPRSGFGVAAEMLYEAPPSTFTAMQVFSTPFCVQPTPEMVPGAGFGGPPDESWTSHTDICPGRVVHHWPVHMPPR
jgi:hypothetical protein